MASANAAGVRLSVDTNSVRPATAAWRRRRIAAGSGTCSSISMQVGIEAAGTFVGQRFDGLHAVIDLPRPIPVSVFARDLHESSARSIAVTSAPAWPSPRSAIRRRNPRRTVAPCNGTRGGIAHRAGLSACSASAGLAGPPAVGEPATSVLLARVAPFVDAAPLITAVLIHQHAGDAFAPLARIGDDGRRIDVHGSRSRNLRRPRSDVGHLLAAGRVDQLRHHVVQRLGFERGQVHARGRLLSRLDGTDRWSKPIAFAPPAWRAQGGGRVSAAASLATALARIAAVRVSPACRGRCCWPPSVPMDRVTPRAPAHRPGEARPASSIRAVPLTPRSAQMDLAFRQLRHVPRSAVVEQAEAVETRDRALAVFVDRLLHSCAVSCRCGCRRRVGRTACARSKLASLTVYGACGAVPWQ